MPKRSSFPPVYDHEFQRASENMRLALPHINKHLTPVNPVNYAVWYEYVSGENQALQAEIDKKLIQDDPITDAVIQQLYEKYVLMGMPERLNNANDDIHLVVNNTLDNLNRAEEVTTAYSSELNNSKDLLSDCNDIDQLKHVVSGILDNTQKLNDSSVELKQELERSTQEIMRLRQELSSVKHNARMDGLTGILNRGAFNKEIESLCANKDKTFCLALLDLDHFKRLNDNFGHLLGDKVLQYFASIIREYDKQGHISARYGGEEMAMLLIGINVGEAFEIVEIIRQRYASSSLKKKGSEESIGQVTVSIGLSQARDYDTPQTLIERTDQALYQSKAEGRNRTTLL